MPSAKFCLVIRIAKIQIFKHILLFWGKEPHENVLWNARNDDRRRLFVKFTFYSIPRLWRLHFLSPRWLFLPVHETLTTVSSTFFFCFVHKVKNVVSHTCMAGLSHTYGGGVTQTYYRDVGETVSDSSEKRNQTHRKDVFMLSER